MDGGRRGNRRLLRGGPALATGIAWTALLGAAAPALAQGEAPAQDAPTRVEELLAPGEEWSLRIELSAWRPGLDGDYGLPGSPARDHALLGLDPPEWSPYVEATIRAERFFISASAFTFDADVDTNAEKDFSFGGASLLEGEDFTLDFSFTEAQVLAGWRVWRWDSGHGSIGARTRTPRFTEADYSKASLMLDLYGGARYLDAHMDFRSASGDSDERDSWLEPVLGGKLSIEFLRDLSIDAAVDWGGLGLTSGGDHSSSTFDITVGARWMFTPGAGVQIGFRQMFFDLEDDGMVLDGSLGGLYGSLVLEF